MRVRRGKMVSFYIPYSQLEFFRKKAREKKIPFSRAAAEALLKWSKEVD